MTSKTIEPGTVFAKINTFTLRKAPFKNNGVDEFWMILELETAPIDGDFSGLLIDYNDPSKGRALGQLGRTKHSRFTVRDGETKMGHPLNRDNDIAEFMQGLCTELGIPGWLDDAKMKYPTAELLIEGFNTEQPFANRFMTFEVDGQTYKNKNGYDAWDLHLKSVPKGTLPFKGSGGKVSEATAPKSAGVKTTPSIPKEPTRDQPKTSSMVPNTEFVNQQSQLQKESVGLTAKDIVTDPDTLPFDLD